jgi:hypothetical protein
MRELVNQRRRSPYISHSFSGTQAFFTIGTIPIFYQSYSILQKIFSSRGVLVVVSNLRGIVRNVATICKCKFKHIPSWRRYPTRESIHIKQRINANSSNHSDSPMLWRSLNCFHSSSISNHYSTTYLYCLLDGYSFLIAFLTRFLWRSSVQSLTSSACPTL